MSKFKLWAVTSFKEYKEEWPSLANSFDFLTSYQQKLGYKSPEDFFIKNAYAAQELANERVGNILERIFSTSDLHFNVQEQLKKFTYKAIDHLRLNDSVIYQNTRNSQTSYNNGRTDSIQNDTINSLEALAGTAAWRSWIGANIEVLYVRYIKENDLPYLLDPDQFYSKKEVDKFFEEIDWKIYQEHTYTTVHISDLQKQINRKQEITDQVLLQQKTDDEGNPIEDIEEIGYFDEILFQSFRPDSIIVDTDRGKKRAVINLNDTIGELINASVYQSSSDIDDKNAIGRIWAWGIENTLKIAKEKLVENIQVLESKIEEVNKSKWIIGERKWVKPGIVMPLGWIKVDIPFGFTTVQGNTEGQTSGEVKNHYHDIKFWEFDSSSSWDSIVYHKKNRELTSTFKSTTSTGGPNNLAAGIYSELWEYIGLDGFKNIKNGHINFKVPYWEKQQQEEKLRINKEKELQEIAKKSDLEPLKQKLEEISPTVEELKAKDKFRMEKLGIDIDDYYKEVQNDENN